MKIAMLCKRKIEYNKKKKKKKNQKCDLKRTSFLSFAKESRYVWYCHETTWMVINKDLRTRFTENGW